MTRDQRRKKQLEQLMKVRAPCTRSPYLTSPFPPSAEQIAKWNESESLEGRTAK